MSASRSHIRRGFALPLVALAAVLVVATTGAALAYWTASGPGTGQASADVVETPDAISTDTVDHESIVVSWAAPAGPEPTSYTVRRLAEPDAVVVCTEAEEAADDRFECTDTGLDPETTYEYTVQAVLHEWKGAQSAPVEAITAAIPAGPPVVTVDFPLAGDNNGAGWAAGCSTAGVCGTATVEDGNIVELVEISIEGPAGWWDETAQDFAGAEQIWHEASGTTDWHYALGLPPLGQYTLHVRATDDRLETGMATRAFTIVEDPPPDAGPGLVSLEMLDVNGNGKVDRVTVVFDGPIESSSATEPWTLLGVPSGGSLASVSTSGSTATLTMAEGAQAADTGVGDFTVALAASPTGIRDAAGNKASFAATAPADNAAPIVVSLADQPGAVKKAAGLAEAGDTLDVTFSEAVRTLPTPVNVLMQQANSGNSTLRIPGLIDGTLQMGARYFTQNGNRSGEFVGSTLSLVNAGKTIQVTLGTYSGDTRATVSSPGGIAEFSPASTVEDAASNAAQGVFTSAGSVLFF